MDKQDLEDLDYDELHSMEKEVNSGIQDLSNRLAVAKRKHGEVCRELEARKVAQKGKPQVSDHAVLRYIERGLGFDVQSVRQRILDKTSAAIKMGAKSIVIDNVQFRIANNVVVTSISDCKKTKSRGGFAGKRSKKTPEFNVNDFVEDEV